MGLYKFSALELSRLMRNKEASAVDVAKSFLSRIETIDKTIRAFISLSADDALETARHVDLKRAGGEKLHPLAGVPVAIKDNICTRGIKTTCASNILQNYIPPYDATVVSKLRRAGLPILGKTNMDEFAMGSSTENSAFFPTCNPWDVDRVPGGSSGGSAAAVAACETPLALGSDTGGSVRQPAAFCGVTGLRPTYGRVSRYGLVAFASSLDQIGTLSANSKDGAALFRLIASYDPDDPTTLNYPAGEEYCPEKSVEKINGLTVGIIKEQTGAGFDEQIVSKLDQMATYLESLGASITEISLPLTDYALAAYYLISPAEACSNLGRYDCLRYGHPRVGDDPIRMLAQARSEKLGMEVKRRIILGTYLLKSGYKDGFYQKALKVRTMIQNELKSAFKHCDLLLGPTAPTTAFKLGEKIDNPLQMYSSDVCTIAAALAGYPAISLFAGLSGDNLPVGMQFTAPPFREELLFQVATAMEEMFPPAMPLAAIPSTGEGERS